MSGLPLLEGIHDSPAVWISDLPPNDNFFPKVAVERTALEKITTCSERMIAHLAPDSLPRDGYQYDSKWDNLAPILLPILYPNSTPDRLFLHGQINYLPDAMSKLMLDPTRLRGGPSRYADVTEVVESALRTMDRTRNCEGLKGWLSVKSLNAFERNVCAFEYVSNGDDVTLYRLKPPFSVGAGAKKGRWDARRDRSAPSPTLVRMTPHKQRPNADFLSDERRAQISELADEYQNGLFVGIDRGEKVKAAISLVPRTAAEVGTSLLLHDRSFRARDREDRSAREKSEAASPLVLLRAALQQKADRDGRTGHAVSVSVSFVLKMLATLDRASPVTSRQRRIQRNQRKSAEMAAIDFMVTTTVKAATARHRPGTAPSLVVVADGSGTVGRRHHGASGPDRRNKPARLFLKRLKERRNIRVVVVSVDEYRTSQTCCSFECQEQVELSEGIKLPIKRVSDGSEEQRLLNCVNDGKVYHRDVSASFLMPAVLVFDVKTNDGHHIFSDHVEGILGLPPRKTKLPKKWALTAGGSGKAKLTAQGRKSTERKAETKTTAAKRARADQPASSVDRLVGKKVRRSLTFKARGIENLQNDCFISSVVQALFWALPRNSMVEAGSGDVERRLDEVFVELESVDSDRSIDVDDLRSAIFGSGIYGHENAGTQQDAGSWLSYLISNSARLAIAFGLEMERIVTCESCGQQQRRPEPTTTLVPAIDSASKLALGDLLQPEFDDRRTQRCTNCKTEGSHRVRVQIKSASDFLLVQPRMSPLVAASPASRINLDEEDVIDLSPFCDPGMAPLCFQLATAVTRLRTGEDAGHYLAYTAPASRLGRSVRFDDETVAEGSWNNFLEEKPTILIYKRLTVNTGSIQTTPAPEKKPPRSAGLEFR
ncbi:hypothetical protein JCM10908_006016 [Rhodotorula pacifica]|uniref:uncharacterized protein n=1 Tax=Rhodotorula pacifica TaxID=1495444 RepID=UPI0031780F19